jgi:hypothetical protein
VFEDLKSKLAEAALTVPTHINPSTHPADAPHVSSDQVFSELANALVPARNLLSRLQDNPAVKGDEQLAKLLEALQAGVAYVVKRSG